MFLPLVGIPVYTLGSDMGTIEMVKKELGKINVGKKAGRELS